MARLDYDSAAAAFAQGRPLARTAIGGWRAAVAPYLGADATRPLLDVGAGTGWLAATFADWFDATVVAVEPAEGMRRQAESARADSRVRFVAGTAESLPVRDQSVRMAWLSTVIHHCSDLPAAARELARVLPPGGRVLIRSAFPDRLDGLTVFRFFPAARRVAETFPSVATTVTTFGNAGFVRETLVTVPQISAPSLAVAAEQACTMRHADSTLHPLTDAEFAAGLRDLESAAASTPATPVVDHIDLLVLRLPPLGRMDSEG